MSTLHKRPLRQRLPLSMFCGWAQRGFGASLLSAALLAAPALVVAQTGDSPAPVGYERVVSGEVPAVVTTSEGTRTSTAVPVIEGAELLPAGDAEPARSAVRTYQQDAGSRVEELRVRGETQQITVTPAGNLPSYEVQPHNSRSFPGQSGRHGTDGTTGPRRWTLGEF